MTFHFCVLCARDDIQLICHAPVCSEGFGKYGQTQSTETPAKKRGGGESSGEATIGFLSVRL